MLYYVDTWQTAFKHQSMTRGGPFSAEEPTRSYQELGFQHAKVLQYLQVTSKYTNYLNTSHLKV